jgi:hypothetical protein
MYDLIGDKALKIKDKSSVKQQIQDELGSDYYHEIELPENSNNYSNDSNNSSSNYNKVDLSPSRDEDTNSMNEASEETKYEEENDEFHISDKRQPKITVTHVPSANKSQLPPVSDSHSTPFLPPPPPNETPINGSESVVSVMSSYQEQDQPSNEYEYIQEENSMFMTPVVPSSSSHQHQLSSSGGFGETPREGGSSIYHGDSTPTFQDLERLPSRERSLSVSDGNEFKRQRVE